MLTINEIISKLDITKEEFVAAFAFGKDADFKAYYFIITPIEMSDIWQGFKPKEQMDFPMVIDIRSMIERPELWKRVQESNEINTIIINPLYSEEMREPCLNATTRILSKALRCKDLRAQVAIREEFFHHLTDNERCAFDAIWQDIAPEGNISVVRMMQQINLSRPVFTSLLQKMEKYNIAEVTAQGVRGTHIKFLVQAEDIPE